MSIVRLSRKPFARFPFLRLKINMDVRGIIKPDILFEFGYSEAEYLPYLLSIRVSDRIPSDPATWGWMQWFGLAKLLT